MNKTIQQAIALGQERMRKSLSPRNDFTHVRQVELQALAIYHELESKGKQLPEGDLLQTAIWWHDSYKALYAKSSLINSIVEGFAAADLTSNELTGLIEPEKLESVLNAIRYHNLPWLYPLIGWLLPKKFNLIGQILIEADTIDSVREDRPVEKLTWKNMFSGLPILKLINLLRVNSYRLYIRSDYAKKILQIS